MDDSAYFSGEKVVGDDLSIEGIRDWYVEEESGYYDLVNSVLFKDTGYFYEYDMLNEYYGYRHIRNRHFHRALAFGCARGDDVEPISENVDEYLAVEPSEKWWSPSIGGKPARFVKPSVSGEIPCGAGEIDLTVCLGVLHHIPNVTHVINEISRVSASSASFILREPISSMGDWRKPRVGLTKKERGFPLKWLDHRLADAGFEVQHRALCMFPITPRLGKMFGMGAYSNRSFVILDQLMSAAMSWNYHYHRDTLFKKLAPSSVFYVLRKI
jgi:hypothetical protein